MNDSAIFPQDILWRVTGILVPFLNARMLSSPVQLASRAIWAGCRKASSTGNPTAPAPGMAVYLVSAIEADSSSLSVSREDQVMPFHSDYRELYFSS